MLAIGSTDDGTAGAMACTALCTTASRASACATTARSGVGWALEITSARGVTTRRGTDSDGPADDSNDSTVVTNSLARRSTSQVEKREV